MTKEPLTTIQVEEINKAFKKVWTAINYLAENVLTYNQLKELGDLLTEDKSKDYEDLKKKSKELFRKFNEPTKDDLKCDWPSSGTAAKGDELT
jgi:hypothetical protein